MADALKIIQAVRGGDGPDRDAGSRNESFRIDARADVPLFVERLGFAVWVSSLKAIWGMPVTWAEASEKQCQEFLRVFPSKLKQESHSIAWLALAQEESHRALVVAGKYREASEAAVNKLSAAFDYSMSASDAKTEYVISMSTTAR